MFRLFPLMAIAVILYNIVAFGHGFTSDAGIDSFLANAVTLHMFSGDVWTFTVGDFFVLLSLLLLFIEIVKSTRTSSRQIVNHGLSMLTFVVALIEFITLKGFSTSPFFFVMFITLFDVIAGYTISIVSAEHDIGLGRPTPE